MSEESAENQIGSGSQPSPEAAVGSAVLTADGGDTLKRLSPWQSSGAALGYVLESSRTDAIQLRTSDRITIIALLVCCILEVLSLSYTPLTGMRLPIIIFCDVVLGVSTVLFLIYRLGILRSLSPRQALVCWQLMMGCVFFGVFLCINMGVAVAFMVTGGGNSDGSAIESPVDPPTQ
ncbi:MAG: hypothetical protein QG625_4203 [Cyanobacteriota bacterium erpe_2018_sw_39hr_WHONDRS-SW48-000098_B_bin.30]|nr:hypothetical protein [Cyanobacteriota bacterium erpe_2018_sw_39hr_WHONDRS-SW48-000098_B_bin.30]